MVIYWGLDSPSTQYTCPKDPSETAQARSQEWKELMQAKVSCGVSVLLLAEHETLTAIGTKVEHGSIDMIASHPRLRKLFMIGCTMTPPQQGDDTKLQHLKSVIEREMAVSIRPILLTAASYQTPERTHGQTPAVTVLDRESLEAISKHIHAGDIRIALQYIDDDFWHEP